MIVLMVVTSVLGPVLTERFGKRLAKDGATSWAAAPLAAPAKS